MSEDRIDRTIAAVACEMTAGEPGGDLRARVMERVRDDAGDRTRSRYMWGPAIVTAAIVLTALVSYRAMRPAVAPPALPLSSVRLNPDSTYAPDVRTPVVESRGAASAPRRTAIAPSPIDALAPTPIDAAPLRMDSLDAAPLDIPPLDTIAPMAIAPLGEGDRR